MRSSNIVWEFPARREPTAKRSSPVMKNLLRPFLSEKFPKVGMKAASTRRETRGTQITMSTGALRLIEIVGSIRAMMPVSSGGTECARLITNSETHLLEVEVSKWEENNNGVYLCCANSFSVAVKPERH